MRRRRIDDSDESSDHDHQLEVGTAQTITSTGRVVKPSAALRDPLNVARQPTKTSLAVKTGAGDKTVAQKEQAGSAREADAHRDKRPKAAPEQVKAGAGQQKDISQESQQEKEIPAVARAAEVQPVLDHDAAHPDGWLVDLDGIDEVPATKSRNPKDRTLDTQFFFANARVDLEAGRKIIDCTLCREGKPDSGFELDSDCDNMINDEEES
ncbi:hypothetical protein JB92DRAFT_3143669 [Gautieria morchelliformis]|nr:hypothetical protein JB92DRAFT_3143669 [Gautieria morchelliformis]